MIEWSKIAGLVEIVSAEANRSSAERFIWFRNHEFARAATASEIPSDATTVLRFTPEALGLDSGVRETKTEPSDPPKYPHAWIDPVEPPEAA